MKTNFTTNKSFTLTNEAGEELGVINSNAGMFDISDQITAIIFSKEVIEHAFLLNSNTMTVSGQRMLVKVVTVDFLDKAENKSYFLTEISKSENEILQEIKADFEMFQEVIIDKLDNLVNSMQDYKKASKLSYVKDKLNDCINYLNDN